MLGLNGLTYMVFYVIILVEYSPFIIHLVITYILIYIMDILWLRFAFTMEFYKGIKGIIPLLNCPLFCLFDLILYVPSTIFQLNRNGSSWVEPVLS